jgi:small subunit ribosomal protein S3
MKRSVLTCWRGFRKGVIARIIIERTLKRITVTIHTSRPGIIIGKGGQEVDRIREELKKLTGKEVQINIIEIRKPELDANIVGESIAKQLEARINYRRAIKMAIQSSMRAGAQGIKVRISGRLNGAEMARSEEFKTDERHCTLSVQISTMHLLKHLPFMVRSV